MRPLAFALAAAALVALPVGLVAFPSGPLVPAPARATQEDAPPAAPAQPGPGALDCDPACNVRITRTAGPANEVMIAVNPLDPDNLVAVAKDYAVGELGACRVSNVWAGVYTTHDGGRTWDDRLMPGHPGDAPGVLSAFNCSSDPVVAFDAQGRALYTGLSLRQPPLLDNQPPYKYWSFGIWVAQSLDKGDTWPLISYAAVGPDPALFHDKQWIAADPEGGPMYLTWSIFGTLGVTVVSSRSLDGVVWSPPVPVEVLTAECWSGQGSQPFVGPGHVLYVGWYSYCDRAIRVARSDDQGLTFAQGVNVAPVQGISTPNSPYRIPTMPAFAADTSPGPHRGTVYAAWQDRRFGGPDIVVARSADGGRTFEAPVRITDDPPGPNVQFFPAIAVGADGTVHATWYDRRDDPGNYRVGVYYARSADGGATWSPNLRVTDQDFDPILSRHQNGYAFLGDYIGIAAGSDGVAHPVWADTRDGRADAYTARILP